MKKYCGIALVLFALLSLSGCVEKVTAPFTAPPVNRDEESFAEFSDVPYPAHLKFSKGDSFTYQRRGMLSGLVVVSGRMNLDELGAYFDTHLPGHGWSPLSDIQYSSALVSTWKKGDKILTVVGRPSALSIVGEVKVELWVAPPYTADDLGKRVVYQKPASRESSSSGGGGILGGIFSSSGSGSKKSDNSVTEEDI